jgi:hypothetical protein
MLEKLAKKELRVTEPGGVESQGTKDLRAAKGPVPFAFSEPAAILRGRRKGFWES